MAEIKYTKKEHIIHQQKANEEAFLAELANGDYTLRQRKQMMRISSAH